MSAKRTAELQYLLPVLLVISLGFLVLASVMAEKGVRTNLFTKGGVIDIAPYTFPLSFETALIPTIYVIAFLLFHLYVRYRLPDADPLILPAVAFLAGLGLIMELRLSPDLAIMRSRWLETHPAALAKDNVLTLARLGYKQAGWLVCGLFAAIVTVQFIPLRKLQQKKYIWVLVSILLTITTIVFGQTINGKTLWLWGFQPVELIKLLLLLFLAGYLYEQGKGMEVARRSPMKIWVQYCGPLLTMIFFAMLPIVLQKDLGPALLLAAVFIVMLQFGGNKSGMTILFVFLIAALLYVCYSIDAPHIVRDRFDKLFEPFSRDESFARALWAVSSGGLFGRGLGYGEAVKIPEVQSDYVFCIIAEEIGLLGALAVILAYALFFQRCLKIASEASNTYHKALAVGIATLFTLQTAIIMLGNLIVIPLTGITLPLGLSYGGSSTVMSFIAVGLLLKISTTEKSHD